MPLFAEIDNDPTFQAAQAALGTGGSVPLQNGVTATYFPPSNATDHFDPSQAIPNGGITGNRGTGTLPNVQGPAIPGAPPAPAAAPTLAPIQGFDTTKLQNPGYVDDKYTAALRDFSGYLGSGGQVSRNNLGGAVSYAQANGFPNAKVVGDDKIDFGDGRGPIDVITSGGQIWFANTGGQGQPGYNPNAPAAGAPTGTLATPQPAAGGGFAGYGGFGSASGGAPSFAGPNTIQPFTAPTAEQAAQMPGYQFALTQGLQALQNSAAAKGGLLGGATGKALEDYGQAAAAQQYQNVYNQALQGWEANANTQLGLGNLNLGYTQAGNQYALGLGGLQNQAQSIANQYALGQGQLGLSAQEIANQYGLGLGAQQLGWANYGLGAQQQGFNQQYSLANLGLLGTEAANQNASSYGNNASNLLTGIGNAQGGSAIAQGNAYGNTFGTLGNGLLGYGLYQATKPSQSSYVNPYQGGN